jgi:hypothetical protein
MPSPEHEHEEQRPSEPYIRAARFANQRSAGRAYFAAQDAIFRTPDSELSVYRLHFENAYHVAVLGFEPTRLLRGRLNRILANGEPINLPELMLQFLLERRSHATSLGSWVKRHRRPLPEDQPC